MVLMLTGVSAHAGRQSRMDLPERVNLAATSSTPIDAKQVHDAIIEGAKATGWTVDSEQAGSINLRLNKQDKHEVRISISYDASSYQIKYVDSFNMNYAIVMDMPYIHPNYNKWIALLSRAIHVGTPEPARIAPAPEQRP